MRSGTLRHIVTIKEPVYTPDGAFGHETTWQDFAVVRAGIWPQKGTEGVLAGREGVIITHRVRIRYLEDINETMIVVMESGKELEIKQILDLKERHREMDLLCEEKK